MYAVTPRETRLRRDRHAPAAARRFVAAHLAGQPAALRERAVLATSELVSNVVRHAPPGTVEVAVRVTSDAIVRIEVAQRGPGFSAPHPGTPAGGWGLVIVDQVADRWGIDERAGHTMVWLELDPD